MHPLDSALRFILELLALCAIGYWGWKQGTDRTRYLLMLLLPAIAAVAWGVFNVPGDPSRGGGAPVRVPGWTRVVIELTVFGSAACVLYGVGHRTMSLVFSIVVLIHYLLSLERLSWRLRQ